MVDTIIAEFKLLGQFDVKMTRHRTTTTGLDLKEWFTVQYGMEIRECADYTKAVNEFSSCVRHAQECAGWIWEDE